MGTGGLVKAYSDAAKLALEKTEIAKKEEGFLVEVELNYDNISDLEHFCKQKNIRITDKEYTEKTKYVLEIPKNIYEKILNSKFQKMEIKIIKEKYI